MKKAIFTILLLSVTTLSFPQEDKFFTINDFSKGQNSHISEFNLSPNQFAELSNVRINKEFGALSKRATMLTYLDFGSTAINSIHRYYNSSGTDETIIATSTLLRVYNDGTALTIADGLSDGKRWQFVNYKDICIMGNDANQPLKYDGHTLTTANTTAARTATELCAELGAPFATLLTGTTQTASKWYQYKMAHYDGSTYDYSEAVSNPIQMGADVHKITLSDIPLGPSGTTHRYIFRTRGATQQSDLSSATFYEIKDLDDNTTTTWADIIADGAEDDSPTWATVSTGGDDINVTPPICPILTIHNERLFTGGHATYPSELYWSDLFNPDHFLPTDYEEIRQDDGDKITFLKVLLGVLTIGKTNTIQKFYTLGSTTTDWSLSSPYSFIGSPAPYSVAASPIGIIYLGRHGLYRFDGQTSSLISDAVTDVINDISQIDIATTVGHYHENEYQLAYTSTTTGATANDRVLIYDLIRDAYVVDAKNVNCFASFSSGTDLGVLYSGSSTTDGYTFAHKGEENVLTINSAAQFADGSHDDTRVYEANEMPYLEIGWDCTIDTWLTELRTKDGDGDNIDTIDDITTYLPDAIIDRPDTEGTWTSPVYYIQASALDKLYWNENLGPEGDVDFYIRLGASTPAGEYSDAFTDPTGSDISEEDANTYLQVKITLGTDDIDYTPYLYSANGYIFKISYSKIGEAYETEINSKCKTGWLNFGIERYPKLIQDLKIYYTGTSGALIFNIKDFDGNIDRNITIDLSINPNDSDEDAYEGTTNEKCYIYRPSVEEPIYSEWYKFEITENGVVPWIIKRIVCRYILSEISD